MTTLTLIPACAPLDLGERIRAEHVEAVQHARAAVEHARRAGDLLLVAKEQAGHGRWLQWLTDNCPEISERTAQGYMRLARAFLAEPERAAELENLSLRDALATLALPKPETETRNGVADFEEAVDDQSWLPDGDLLISGRVLSGDEFFVQRSMRHPGHFMMVRMLCGGDDEGAVIEGNYRPVQASATTRIFRTIWGRDPNTIGWEFSDAPTGALEDAAGILYSWRRSA